MLNGRAKQLLDAPKPTPTRQGLDTYPRVIHQADRGDGSQLVTFAVPGLRRVKAWVPETHWVNGDHLSMNGPMLAHLARIAPLPDYELEALEHFDESE